jgi:hypothetical protein
MVAVIVCINMGFLFRQKTGLPWKVTCRSVPGASFDKQNLILLFITRKTN